MGSRGGHARQGAARLKCWQIVKALGSCQHTQGGHTHICLGTGLMRPEGEGQSLRSEWNSWTFSHTSGLASRGS